MRWTGLTKYGMGSSYPFHGGGILTPQGTGGKDTCSPNCSMVRNSYSSGNKREGGGVKDTCSPNCSMVGNSYSSGNAAAPSSCPKYKEYLMHRSILFSDIL